MTTFRDRLRHYRANRQSRKLTSCLQSGMLDKLLDILLRLMKFMFLIDHDYQRNIRDFEGSYSFKSGDGRIAGSAVFANGEMKVFSHRIENADIEVTFRDGNALREFLFSKDPDIIKAILDNQITYNGNLNYLGKFAFMARHLQLRYGF